MNAADYAKQLQALLPPGAVWLLESGSVISGSLLAVAEELARVDGRAAQVLEEADPRTANETIEQWEKMLGLPDELVTAIPATLAERRVAVTQKFASLGGQSVSFFVQLAALCGYAITLSTYQSALSVSGVMQAGDELAGLAAAYAMKVTVSPPAGTALSYADFERVIRHATHAHIIVEFVYL